MRTVNHRRHWTTGLAGVVLGLALLPAASGAAPLPDPAKSKRKIVANESIGGVKLDMSQAKVKKLWGKGSCADNGGSPPGVTCKWGKASAVDGEQALVSFIGDEAAHITITAHRNGSSGAFIPGKLSKWKTPGGIHLGSPITEVPVEFPGATPNNGEAVQGYDLFSGVRPDLRYTRFAQGSVPNGKMMYLSLVWDVCHYMDCGP